MRIFKDRKKDNNKDSKLLTKAKEKMAEASGQAEEYAKSPSRLRRLVYDTKQLMQLDSRRYNLKKLIYYVTVFSRLIKDSSSGAYPHLPWKSLVAIVGSFLYFLNPLDAVPDFIPFVGYLDDITLMAWVYRSIESDVERYLGWAESED